MKFGVHKRDKNMEKVQEKGFVNHSKLKLCKYFWAWSKYEWPFMVINNYYTVATVIKPTVHIVLSHSQGTNTLCPSVLEKATSNRSCIEFTRIEISKDKHFIHILYVVYHNYYCVTFSFFVGYGSFSRRLTISCLAICHVLFYCY